MFHVVKRRLRAPAILLFLIGFFSPVFSWASVGGSISGTVKDPSGSVLPNATVVAREVNKDLTYRTRTDKGGYYTLPVLPVGRYELDVQAPGFRDYHRKDIVLDTNAALTLDVSLQVGGRI